MPRIWMRSGQRVRYRSCRFRRNQRVLKERYLPLAVCVLLRHQRRTGLDILLLVIQVPLQICVNEDHRYVWPHETHLLYLITVVAAFVDRVEDPAMTLLDVLASVKEPAQHMNEVGVAGKLRSPRHAVRFVPCLFESVYHFQQSSLLPRHPSLLIASLISERQPSALWFLMSRVRRMVTPLYN